jgi:hypothetical protein
VPKLSINLEEILSRAHGNFENQNRFLEFSVILINYYFIIIHKYCNYKLMRSVTCISKKGFIEECVKEGSLEVTWVATTSCLKRKL